MALLPAHVKVQKQLVCYDAVKLALTTNLSDKPKTQR